MRFRVWVTAGLLLLVSLVWVVGGRAERMEDMRKEMGTVSIPGRTFLDMRVPLVMSGTTAMPLSEVCVAGGSIHPMDPSKRTMDMGKAPPGNQYAIPVYLRFVSDSGDHIFLYYRMIELPACE
jgi:hypothetical protein